MKNEATVIEGGLQLAGNLMNNLFANSRSKKQYEYDRKLMELQNQMNIEMWNMQNRYNSPKAQMERYTDAGLNPNLIYSQGNSGNATAPPEQQVARYQAPQFEVKGLENIAHTFLQERMYNLTEEKTKEEINLLKQQIIMSQIEQTNRIIDRTTKQLTNHKLELDNRFTRDSYAERMKALGFQNDLLQVQRQTAKYNLDVMLPLQSQEQEQLIEKLKKDNVYQSLVNDDFSLKAKTNKTLYRNIANKTGYEIQQIQKALELAQEQIRKLKVENDLSDFYAVVTYLNTLSKYDYNKYMSAEMMENILENYFDIKFTM